MTTAPPRSLRVVQPHVQLMDPHLCNDDRSALSLQAALYDPLVRRVDAERFAPALATSWRVSDDACTWVFELRDQVRAHDGEPFTPDDALASLERVRDPSLGGVLGTEGVYASYLADAEYRLSEARDGVRLRVKLARPMADLLDLVCAMPMVPRRAHGRHAGAPVGTGPYRLVRRSHEAVVLARWDGYWGERGRYEELTFRAEPMVEARAGAVQAGSADVATHLSPALAHALTGSHGVEVVARASSTCVVGFFDLLGRPPCSPVHDARVRRALHHASDVDAIVAEVVCGYARRIAAPITERSLGHDKTLQPYAFDPTHARALLAEAGYGDGCDLVFHVPTTLPDEAPALSERLRRQWGEVGVRLKVKAHADRPAYARMVRDKRIGDLCLFDSSPVSSYRLLVEKLQSSVQGLWWQGYANPELDALVEQAAATPATAARRDLYRRAFRLLHDDAPWLSLYAPDLLWLKSVRLSGWEPSVTGLVVA